MFTNEVLLFILMLQKKKKEGGISTLKSYDILRLEYWLHGRPIPGDLPISVPTSFSPLSRPPAAHTLASPFLLPLLGWQAPKNL